MSSYLAYIRQAVKNRAGLERYWQEAPADYPRNLDVLVGYAPFEVIGADQDERVEGVVIAEFPPFEQTVGASTGLSGQPFSSAGGDIGDPFLAGKHRL
jgi:hypothetical protein